MQILAHPAFLSKGGSDKFCCVLALLLAQTKFLRCRFALWTFPPIGCAFVFASAAIMQSVYKGELLMSSKPSHRAYVVTKPNADDGQKGFWHEVGVVWPHKTGNGFDVVIHEGISVSGRIVCTAPKDKSAK
jgi:hypothetical protein